MEESANSNLHRCSSGPLTGPQLLTGTTRPTTRGFPRQLASWRTFWLSTSMSTACSFCWRAPDRSRHSRSTQSSEEAEKGPRFLSSSRGLQLSPEQGSSTGRGRSSASLSLLVGTGELDLPSSGTEALMPLPSREHLGGVGTGGTTAPPGGTGAPSRGARRQGRFPARSREKRPQERPLGDVVGDIPRDLKCPG